MLLFELDKEILGNTVRIQFATRKFNPNFSGGRGGFGGGRGGGGFGGDRGGRGGGFGGGR